MIAGRFVSTLSILSSISFFLLIAVDRYYVITRPLPYRYNITRKGTKARVVIVWVVAIGLRFVYFVNYNMY